MKTLAVKYRPTTFDAVTGQGYTISILKNQLKNDKIKAGYLFAGASGCGKALANYEVVLTEKGWKPIGEVMISDKIYGEDGKLHNVVGVYKQQGRITGYDIHFTDGTKITCSGDHIWWGHWTYNVDSHKREVALTKDLYKEYIDFSWGKNHLPRFRIDRCMAIDFPPKVVAIPPRLFGYLLSLIRKFHNEWGILITSRNIGMGKDLLKQFGIELSKGKRHMLYGKKGTFYHSTESDAFGYFDKFLNYIKQSVAGNRLGYIPAEYLYNTKSIRKELLLGILLTAQDGVTVFRLNSNNDNFVNSFRELGKGLGCNVPAFNYRKAGKSLWRLQIIPNSEVHGFIRKHIPSRALHRERNIFTGVSIDRIELHENKEEYTCLEVDNPSHLYITTGYIPTHNTTVARIFASELGDNTEIIEIDAASNSGVDNTRELIKEAHFKSLRGGKKVYIIDECHSLSATAWQSLLKTLEEPPPDVVFIFCTTEPHKVPLTIQNRLMRFNFTRMEIKQMTDRLKLILDAEKITKYEDEALDYIAKVSHGGMRDAIANMEKVINSDLEITTENVCSVLSLVAYSDMFTVLDFLLKEKHSALIKKLDEIYLAGGDLKRFVVQFIAFQTDVLKWWHTGDLKLTDIPPNYKSDLEKLGLNDKSVRYIKDTLFELMQLNTKLIYETNPKSYIEMFFMGVRDDWATS